MSHRTVKSAVILLIFALNAHFTFSHNLPSTQEPGSNIERNSGIHHSLLLESEYF